MTGNKKPAEAGYLENEMGKLLFEVKTPDGKTYQLHDDGGMKGFPDGTMIECHVADVKRREHPVMRFYDSRIPAEFMRRRLVVTIENDIIGDGYFRPEVSKTLRELADLMDAGKAGNKENEAYLGSRGTIAILREDGINAVCIPFPETHTQDQAGGQKEGLGESP